MHRKATSLALFLFFLTATSFGQNEKKSIERSFDTWWSNINRYELPGKWSLGSELHVRRTQGLERWRQFLIRPFLNYSLSDRSHLSAGYTFIQNYPRIRGTDAHVREHNVWEQVTLDRKAERLSMSHRYRLEHRWIGTPALDQEGNTVRRTERRERFRYRFTMEVPLLENDKLFFEAFNELWVNLFQGSKTISMNQNWTYGGLAFRFSKKGKLGVGYMRMWAPQGGNSYLVSDIVQTTLSFDLDLAGDQEKRDKEMPAR
jgi:hypothetical protein